MSLEILTTLLVLILILSESHGFLVPDGLQVVQTRLGEIQGTLGNVNFENQNYQVTRFLGIPYAEPPVGDLRYRKPVPVRNFPSPLKATSFGPICPQRGAGNTTMSEDCLYLNVVVPTTRGAGVLKKPVMVWIHGGAFVTGSSNQYNTDTLSAFTDVIVVTINYRLGALGFFTTGDKEAAGNFGLWDQHQAIRWVHDNIEAFGGDSDNITIFGESAGSSSVVFQTTYPGNRGLFKRAIAESGTIAGWAVQKPNGIYNNSLEIAQKLGCNSQNHAELMACLRRKPSKEIEPIVAEVGIFLFPFNSWVPVFDNDFVIMDPASIFSQKDKPNELLNSFRDIDLLIGWNNYDAFVYLFDWVPLFNITSLANFSVTQDQFVNYYIPNVAELALINAPTSLSKDTVLQEYTYFQDPDNDNKRIEELAVMATDALLKAPTILTATTHTSYTSNTFVYEFGAQPPFRILDLPTTLQGPDNSNHADEMLFVFGNDISRYNKKNEPRTPSQQTLTKAMMTMWSNFAKSGNPNKPRNVKAFYDVDWMAFTPNEPRYLRISLNISQASVRSSTDLKGVDFWNNILPEVQASST